MQANYHTHTRRCKHATGDIEDYCRAAQHAGLSVLGFSDHAALPDNRWHSVRMEFDEREEYCAAIEHAQEVFHDMTILKSMECEYEPRYRAYFEDELLGRLELDYLVGAAHFIPHEGRCIGAYGNITSAAALRSYTRAYVGLIEWGLFAFIAHPDMFGNCYLEWDAEADACSREILAAAEAHGVPLEINGYGFRKAWVETPQGSRPMYPWMRFWEVAAEFDIEVVLSSDAHRPEDVAANLQDAAGIAAQFGLRIADLSCLEPDRQQ
ncbi:MAG TPA: histidinol-phosphatase [Candidatus Hydrogenedentes bacterium]|nr:histidinol-phosphatase [Candidatus Hydrogenedentota bacterium]